MISCFVCRNCGKVWRKDLMDEHYAHCIDKKKQKEKVRWLKFGFTDNDHKPTFYLGC
jgi:hypothetical protein